MLTALLWNVEGEQWHFPSKCSFRTTSLPGPDKGFVAINLLQEEKQRLNLCLSNTVRVHFGVGLAVLSSSQTQSYSQTKRVGRKNPLFLKQIYRLHYSTRYIPDPGKVSV